MPADRMSAITEALRALIPGATPENLTITLTETPPDRSPGVEHSWTGTPEAAAQHIDSALRRTAP